MNYTPDHERAWEAALKILSDQLSMLQFTTWIQPLKLHSVTPDSIIFLVDNVLIKSRIISGYRSTIDNAVRIAFGRQYDIVFFTAEELENNASVPRSTLNPKYKFENFVVGSSNHFAYVASLAVAEQPSDVYNPLFIYGNVGLGKTHLINAIGNYIMAEDPMKNVLFTTSENFTNELIDALVQKKGTSELRSRMRKADVLIVDDIQFLSRTKATQEEFFHTFNELHEKGKQIIISSDRPPKDIPTLEERLRTRFEWGLLVDIARPDYETRVAILRKKADDENIDISMDVIEYIAERVDSNIRELEGALNRLKAECELLGNPITLDAARNSLTMLMRSNESRRVTAEGIISVISEQFGVSSEAILSKNRSSEIALPRQIAMYLTREMTQLSTTNIGKAFGGRDHTTVLHGCEKIADKMKKDIAFKRRIEELSAMIRNG